MAGAAAATAAYFISHARVLCVYILKYYGGGGGMVVVTFRNAMQATQDNNPQSFSSVFDAVSSFIKRI